MAVPSGQLVFMPTSGICVMYVQVKRRSTYLMTLEMSTYGSLVLLTSMWWSPDGVSIQKLGFFYGWSLLTFVSTQLLPSYFVYYPYSSLHFTWLCSEIRL